ncbi:SusD/RagB family nutrient-binding outer membrane lipoprotein [Polaribacter ponticola]|uniref:SusD/RagB family nutrient-binding outer membrane lipoprotein n=1 Tax=Polaribacter ponticola TaxID=2978475 RepID=A0ABT5SBU6_9FLAO|nr:SusD/RagB family nutrient-binding outer membrane lipoprotein [Polaribacter sp. MSW5]MDD7914747.1 SusD/RagB family nutrient-binding outer membrane lipoprotein [Polaribacter sp. MSW5]
MRKLIIILNLAILSVFAVSCESFLNVNEDPNNPVDVSPDLKLPVALNYTNGILNNRTSTNSLGNLMLGNWSQSDGYSWYLTEFQYNVTTSFYGGIWNTTYGSALKQYHSLDVTTENNEYYQAIAKIMKTFHFQILVDTYGDIPYTEALQRGANTTPAYDDALTVYEDLIVQLDNAIALINQGASNFNVIIPGSDDGVFAGNMNEWKKFANTIKLRILVRQSSMAGRASYITQEFAKIASEGSGYITENAGSNIGYNNSTSQQSPFWGTYKANVEGTLLNNFKATCATPFALNTLMNLNDARIDYIYEIPLSGTHLGVEQGLSPYPAPVGTLGEDNVSNIGPGLLKSPEQDVIIFSLAEAKFLQAEAAQRGLLNTISAKVAYEQGVKASFDYLGASMGDYLTQIKPLANWDASPNKIEAIMTQKYIALNGVSAGQSWFDYSRTGYPTGLPVSLQASTADRPVRLAYPSSEITGNSANVPAQPNVFTTKIFWAN